MPPVSDTRLPAIANDATTKVIARPHARYARGAAEPRSRATSAGRTKMPAPTVVLTMLAVSPRTPIARTSPCSLLRGVGTGWSLTAAR